MVPTGLWQYRGQPLYNSKIASKLYSWSQSVHCLEVPQSNYWHIYNIVIYHAVLLADATNYINAFNLVNLQAALHNISVLFPPFLQYLWCTYRTSHYR